MNDAVVAFEAMGKSYDGRPAVDALTLEVHRGEMFGLIGPDGAGKTTSLRVALGLLAPDSGRVTTCGLDPRRERRALSGKVGYLSQRFSLYGDLTVEENLRFFAAIHGAGGERRRLAELLDLVRLAPFKKRLADRLSGGMKQKLALASTLVHRPELLVLDEPTTGVDPVSRRDFWKLLAELRRQGLTIVMSTPYLDEAERCQRVGLLDHGQLLALDDPQRLRRQHAGAVVEVLARPRRRAAEVLATSAGVRAVETFGERLHVALDAAPDAPETARRLGAELAAAGVEVTSSRPVPPSLEDVFIARVRSAERLSLFERGGGREVAG